MKKLRNTEAELKKTIAYKKAYSSGEAFRTHSNTYGGTFFPLTIFAKKLHRRCLTGF